MIPDTPEPSRGRIRNNRKQSQKISGKNLEQLFTNIIDTERPRDILSEGGDIKDTRETITMFVILLEGGGKANLFKQGCLSRR